MKRLLFTTAIIILGISINAQDISGQWNGVLKAQGSEMGMIINISKTDVGFRATMDVPAQGAKGVPFSSTSFEKMVLKLELSSAGIEYIGTLNEKGVFIGTYEQAGQSIPLKLTKESLQKKSTTKPQEPSKPYPYYSEDITFENNTDKIVLAGTLTLPEKDGLFPAVILISGSGPQNRNEELLGHKPFLVLADYLTKNGIAVLRFDDRGIAESTGDFSAANSSDFARDVEFAVKYLKTRKEVNKDFIGLIGHSEGGIIAPMIAADSKDISFIVLLAGSGIRGDQLLLMQQELIGKISCISDAELQKTKKVNSGAFNIIVKSKDRDVLKSDLKKYITETAKENPLSGMPAGMTEEDYIDMQVDQLTSPWMVYFIKYDPAPVLEKINCPVLAINGGKDLQVPSKVNLEAINKALKKGGNKEVTIKEFPELNHLFQECETGLMSEYATLEQTFSPIALEEISSWILKQVR